MVGWVRSRRSRDVGGQTVHRRSTRWMGRNVMAGARGLVVAGRGHGPRAGALVDQARRPRTHVPVGRRLAGTVLEGVLGPPDRMPLQMAEPSADDRAAFGESPRHREKATMAQVFVHYTEIQTLGVRSLRPDQRVEFDVVPGSQGPRAMAVRLL
jgi:cold shock CspA family protein